MASSRYLDSEPITLVDQFSMELEISEAQSARSEEWEQLRLDLVEERKRRANETREELKRIEQHFLSAGCVAYKLD